MPRSAVAVPRFSVRPFGTCLNFDGVDDVVILATEDEFTASSKITLSAWIKPTTHTAIGTLIAKRTGGTATFQWRLDAGVFRFTWTNGGAFNSYDSAVSIPLKQWSFVALTFDYANPGSANYYINGSYTTTARTAGSGTTPDDANVAISIGRRNDSSQPFNGLIDDVKVHTSALTQAQLDTLYYTGTSATTPLHHYKFDEGSGTSATDSGSANNTGTITGAVYSSDVFMPARTTAGNRQVVRDFGTCLRFDDATTDVTVASQLFYQNTGYTVSFWVKANRTNSGDRFICLGSTASNNQVFLIENDGTSGRKIKIFIRRDDNLDLSPASPRSNKDVFDGFWHHIVWADNNGAAKMYIDGVQDTNDFSYSRSGAFTFNRTGFGALVRAAVSTWMLGQLDDIRIWNNTVLTAQQVTDLYYKGMNPSTPTSWYKFDEGSGTTATDSGSLATNGTITAATYSTDVPIKPRTAV